MKDLLAKAKEKNVQIHLPVDFVVGDKFAEDATSKVVSLTEGVPAGVLKVLSCYLFDSP